MKKRSSTSYKRFCSLDFLMTILAFYAQLVRARTDAFCPTSGWRKSRCHHVVHDDTSTTQRFTTGNDSQDVAASSSSTSSTSSYTPLIRNGLAKMNVVMTREFFQSSPSLKNMYTACVKNVEVRESTLPGAGRGLFAAKNIKANSIVSFYPAHALGIDGEPFLYNSINNPQDDGDDDDEAYFATHPSSESAYLHCTDQPIFQRQSLLQDSSSDNNPPPPPLYLDVNPNRNMEDTAWVSHMINDGATVSSNTEQGVLDYYRQSLQRKNCIHIPFGPSPIMATVSTKKIKKGEEILTSYGGTYWLGVLLDVYGEEGVGITPAIQAQIQQTANDLRSSLQKVAVVYASQIQALEEEFQNIPVNYM